MIGVGYGEPILLEADRLRASGRLEEALGKVDSALGSAGDLPPLLLARVTLLRELGRCSEALEASTRLLTTHPNLAEAHVAEGFVRLLVGDWSRGWSCREWRWQQPAFRRLIPRGIPVWDGSPCRDDRLRVVPEQGLGDFIQCCRFLTEVRTRVGSVVVETPRPLLRLMQASFAGIDFVPEGSKVEADVWVGLMSLPERLRASPQSLPSPGDYLLMSRQEPQGAVPVGHPAPGEPPRTTPRPLRIGVAPSGNPRHFNDRLRSLPAGALEPLARARDVEWYRIQPENPVECGLSLQNPPWPLHDLADTARWMHSLDLILSVDTSVAHLAGALGRPVWILLPFAPDWRWGLNGERSPWYASARLLRQSRPADWSTVVTDLSARLATLRNVHD